MFRRGRRDKEEISSLAHLLDDLVRDGPAGPGEPDPPLLSSVRDLHARDGAHAAEPAFVSRGLEDLMRNPEFARIRSGALALPLSPMPLPGGPVPGRNGRTDPFVHHPPAPPRRTARPWAWPARAFGQAATAAMLVLTLVGSVLIYTEGHRVFRPTAQDATETPDFDQGWPQYRGNAARTGEMPGPGVDGGPRQRWSVEFGGPVSSSPAVVGGMVYIGSMDGVVHALDAASGTERWFFQAQAGVGSSPAVEDGVVYIGDDTGTLYALDAATGAERWRVANGPVSNVAAAAVDGVLYVGGQDANLYALDGASGEEIWRSALPAAASRSTAVADGVVYVGCQDGSIIAVDAETGSERWRFATGGGTVATPTVAFGTVFAASVADTPSRVYALDPATGAERWRFETQTGAPVWAPSAGANSVFVTSDDGSLYALDPTTGAVRWRFERDDPMVSSPAIVDGVVYVGSDNGSLYALDAATGFRLWRFALDGRVSYGPAVAGGVVYVGTENNHLYAIGGAHDAAVGDGAVLTAAANPEPTTVPTAEPTAIPPAESTEGVSSIQAPVVAREAPVEFLWQTSGGSDPLNGPTVVGVHPDGAIWVMDTGNNRFQIFDADGAFIETWGRPGTGEGQFALTRSDRGPAGSFTFDSAGNLYVSDAYNARVQKFDRDRTFVTAWGGRGTGDGEFLLPEGIVVDAAGTVWVVDIDASAVQQFDADGRFLTEIELPGLSSDGLIVPVRVGDGIVLVFTSGTTHRITVFGPDGTKVAEWGESGNGPGQFSMPLVVAFDADGRAFVTDVGNGRVEVLDADGRYLTEWDASGTELGAFVAPTGITLDDQGNVYVVDTARALVAKFRLLPPLAPESEHGGVTR